MLNNALKKESGTSDAVVDVQIVKGKSLCDYSGDDDCRFVKIYVTQPKFIAATKRVLKADPVYKTLQFFESNVDIETR